jgi:hypothetical protein
MASKYYHIWRTDESVTLSKVPQLVTILEGPGHRLSWLMFFVDFLSCSRKGGHNTWIKLRSLPSSSYPSHCNSIIRYPIAWVTNRIIKLTTNTSVENVSNSVKMSQNCVTKLGSIALYNVVILVEVSQGGKQTFDPRGLSKPIPSASLTIDRASGEFQHKSL